MSEMKVEGSKIPAEDITNPELKEAIEAMQAEGSKQNIDNMINKVIEAKFILPARVTQIPSASTTNGRTVMNSQTQVQFRLLENTKKEKFFGVFTDIEELYRWKGNEEAQKVVTDFDSVAHMGYLHQAAERLHENGEQYPQKRLTDQARRAEGVPD